jgi:hypothetical protein
VWLACSPGPTVAGTPEIGAPRCAPWDQLDVDLGAAEITWCDPDRLVVHFPPGSADALGPAFRTAVREAGWEEEVDSTAPGMVNVRYEQGENKLALSIVDNGPETVVILTVLRR